MPRRTMLLSLIALGIFPIAAIATAVAEPSRGHSDPFALDGSKNIRREDHFGIINGQLTCGIPYRNAFAVSGLWAPPYVSTNFNLNITLMDQPVATDRYTWHPLHVNRAGAIDGINIQTITMLIPGSRAGLVAARLTNTKAEPRTVPVAISVGGTLSISNWWEFGPPISNTATTPKIADGAMLLEQGDMAIVLRANQAIHWENAQPSGRGSIFLPPLGETKLYIAFAIGSTSEAQAACKKIAADPKKAMVITKTVYAQRAKHLFQKLPTFKSSNKSLEKLYNRSLVHLLTNRWDVEKFILNPYYSTGSIRGGCVCDYLWNFGEIWEILPLLDPEAAKKHIKKFLSVDMTKHFAFEPTTGKAFGPWYMVNQEKIIGMIYYYVKITGDKDFLSDVVDDKTVLEHVILNAMHRDDPTKPVRLIDYGSSNSHLELRRGLPYNHVMPDLNGRRYNNYVFAAELAELAGKPKPMLRRRAEELKTVLKDRLWNKETRWFDFENDKGKKNTRYTVQIFKLFGSDVLDDEQESGLLEHLLSEKEFLSEFGLHSLAKGDPAYDPADVDNGGPGACTCFPPQIIERLYKSGNPAAAEEILKRILWWGERMPYWGDSIVADKIGYRHDTPLQCTIDGATVAQCIIFGMFGVQVEPNGDILINPQPPTFAPQIALQRLKLQGHVLDITVNGAEYEVREGNNSIRATISRPILVRGNQLLQR